jgi:hypothetical protein
MEEPTRNRQPRSEGFGSAEPMSHEEAIKINAVEMYILRELADEDELRFEAHYFECHECAQAVLVEQTLTASAQTRPEPWWRRLAFPVLIPVAASFMAVAAFQAFRTIPLLKEQVAQLSAPTANTVITAHPVELGTANGEPIQTPSVTVEVTLPPGAASRFYRVDILGEGKPPLSQVLPEPRGSRLSLHVPSKTLGHGSFNVLVYGLATSDSREGPQAGQYRFNIP